MSTSAEKATKIRRLTPSQPGSKILGLESRMAGDAGKHCWAEFDGIVERKYEIRIPVSGKNTV